MYFVTSQALNEQYLLAGGNGVPGEEFRLGFNVNRIFALGQKRGNNYSLEKLRNQSLPLTDSESKR